MDGINVKSGEGGWSGNDDEEYEEFVREIRGVLKGGEKKEVRKCWEKECRNVKWNWEYEKSEGWYWKICRW